MTKVIETKRLRLRQFKSADAAPMTKLIADWDVIQWLTSPPFPYVLSDAKWFIGEDCSNCSYAVEIGGEFAGVVGLTDDFDLGYWLGKPHHRNGFMTEAAGAVVNDHFTHNAAPLTSGYLLGNGPSQSILEKVRFENTEIKAAQSVPQKKRVQVPRMQLSQEKWRLGHV